MIVLKSLRVEGVDFTPALAMPYKVKYKKVRGPNAGNMQNGDYRDDVKTTKAVVTLRGQPMAEETAAQLATFCRRTYVQVYYYDLATRAYRTMTAMPSEPEWSYNGVDSAGVPFWDAQGLEFTEK